MSETGSESQSVQETEEMLKARLAEMADSHDSDVALLESLASALFPNGDPSRENLTWPDNPVGAYDAAGGSTSSAKRVAAQGTEERLRAAEARFRSLVEQIPAITFMAVLGEGKNEIYVSPHIQTMLGFSQEEWLENPFLWYRQLHPDDRALWNAEFTRGCQTGGPFRAECRYYARDGRIVWVHGEARLVRDDLGRPMFLQGVAFDITESKRAQEVLITDAVETARVDEELAIARRVQTALLPKSFRVEGLDIAGIMVPASEVGGDYYDVLPFKGGAWFAIGDVSGHGINAGLVMLMLQSAVAAITRAIPDASPKEVMSLANEHLYDAIRSRLERDDHITCSLFKYWADGRVTFAGAHEEILIFREATRSIERIPPVGTWLGGRRDIRAVTTNTEFKLEPGDLVALYTDGVTEAMNAKKQLYDIERLCALIETVRDQRPDEICAKVLADVREWMDVQHDDISLLVLRHSRDA